jgi:hypothetical protein
MTNRNTVKRFLETFCFLLCAATVYAQRVPVTDTTDYFFKPGLSVFVAPLAMADYIGGYNFRFGTEYSLNENVNGLTEVSIYMPWHQRYHYVSGFKVRQDFRKYIVQKQLFMGGSIMIKQQKLDYTAVVPIDDSTRYLKPYTLSKIVVSPSFVLGFTTRLNEHWYIDLSGYAGLRFKFAEAQGLTPTERSTMWNYNLDYTDWDNKIMLKQGQHPGIELQASVRVGYYFG